MARLNQQLQSLTIEISRLCQSLSLDDRLQMADSVLAAQVDKDMHVQEIANSSDIGDSTASSVTVGRARLSSSKRTRPQPAESGSASSTPAASYRQHSSTLVDNIEDYFSDSDSNTDSNVDQHATNPAPRRSNITATTPFPDSGSLDYLLIRHPTRGPVRFYSVLTSLPITLKYQIAATLASCRNTDRKCGLWDLPARVDKHGDTTCCTTRSLDLKAPCRVPLHPGDEACHDCVQNARLCFQKTERGDVVLCPLPVEIREGTWTSPSWWRRGVDDE